MTSDPVSSMLLIATVVAIVGGGLVTGLLFAFSNFALASLADLEPRAGMYAMQRINLRIINPLFFVLFFGTPLACAAIVAIAWMSPELAGRSWLVAGALCYLVGPFGITGARNVPLNNRLEAASLDQAETVWPAYRREWQFWNHLRTALGAVAMALLARGALAL